MEGFIENLKIKRPNFAKKKVLLHQGNARGQECVVVMELFNEVVCELLSQLPYFLEWEHSDFFQSLNLKKWLHSKTFGYNDEIIVQPMAYFEDFDKSYQLEGVKKILDT